MIDEPVQNCEDVRPDQWRLGPYEAFFDVVSMPSATPVHICAALPNARALQRWPSFPSAALPASGRVANGCGLTEATSRRSAIGEAVELLKSCVWGDELLIRAAAKDIQAQAIRPEELLGFSSAQIKARDRENQRFAGQDWITKASADDTPLEWIEAEDAKTGNRLLVPADVVLIGRREAGDTAAVAVADSNGCACGSSEEAAKHAALLELIERDAVGRWWYAQRRRPCLDPGILGASSELRDHLEARSRLFRMFHITSDLEVPVVAAASYEPDGAVVALGFAAKPSLPEAALAATIEMLATETSLPPWRDVDDDVAAKIWVDQVNAFELPAFSNKAPEGPSFQTDQASWTLDDCVAALLSKNCRLLFVDLSRGDNLAPVFRALSPELCHIRPRLGKARLYAPDARDLGPPQVPVGGDISWPILY
ncbi:YcaO-like family protein [Falsiruegeria mediterranea]